jgi:PIN domain nuclease of toxin-antitoxin system
MKYLLDAHTLIWFLNGDTKLPADVRAIIEDGKNNCFVSIASLWEIAIKHSSGKLDLNMPFHEINRLIEYSNIELLAVSFDHLLVLNTMPLHHNDPFDRIIISQSIHEKITILTKDSLFKIYPVSILWK